MTNSTCFFPSNRKPYDPSHLPQGYTLWFTGWSGAGKTALAVALEKELIKRNVPYHIQRLDGDVVRESLTKDLGFSKADRQENIRRVTFVAQMLSTNGVATLVSFISPYKSGRAYARERCQNFIEVFVDCPKEELIRRDVKGLYKKALKGEIADFTGISAPYEPPECPEIRVNSGVQTLEESLEIILAYLWQKELIT